MSDTAILINPAQPNPASGSTAAEYGTLSVTTDPSPLAIAIYDAQMNTVGEGVSPLKMQLAPGLYVVRATLAAYPDLKSMAWVVSHSNRSVHLSETKPNWIRVLSSMGSALRDTYVHKLVALPPQPQGTARSANEPEVRPEPFYIRFFRLKDWDSAERVALPKFSSAYVRGRAILDVTNPQENLVFAQIAGPGGSVLNVAIPSAGVLRPVRFQLVISASTDLLKAYVRLSTDWANAAMQYMARGYMDQAKQLVMAGSELQPGGLARLVRRIADRFDDPAAAFVPRYVALRAGEATVTNVRGESFLDLPRHLSDELAISAEVAARERQFRLAAQHIVDIRPGGMPLFTEGFSLLIHRVRELVDLDPGAADEDRCPVPEQIAKLKELWQILSRWAPYVDLNSPTVTFFGNDVTAPRATETPVVPIAADGWIRGPEPPSVLPTEPLPKTVGLSSARDTIVAEQGRIVLQPSVTKTGAPILVLKQLDKRFGATHALKAVNLTFETGEIHAIVGENGAGKSTLIKLVTGVYLRTSGEIYWEGKAVALATPHEAIEHGINAVHQEVVLCPHLTVAANLFLGDENVKFGMLQHRKMVREGQRILDDLGFNLPAGALLSDLTIGQQQLVATARASKRGTRCLIFDEPTGYLTRQEAAQLFTLIRRLKTRGVTIVYISHRLEEVFQLCDRVSILRDGQLVSTQKVSETNEEKLIVGMINRSVDQVHYKEAVPFGPEILRTENLTGKGFEDVSIRVRSGEVIGLYGLIGAGRSEFVLSLFGRFPKTAGRIFWNGKPIDIHSEKDAISRGIALVPESRRDQGLCLNLGVGFNLNLPVYKRLTTGIIINPFAERAAADKQIRDLRIKTSSRDAPVSSLSGGNQQKIVVGKWLNHGAELFIFDEPTVGVDVATKFEIYKLFARLLKAGAGIILISSYLPEVCVLSDTLHVFRQGRLVSSLIGEMASHETILTEAIGV